MSTLIHPIRLKATQETNGALLKHGSWHAVRRQPSMLAIDDGVIGWTLSDKFRLVSVLLESLYRYADV
ncbi:MAG: hypothetical protein P8L48_05815 [Synechococcus sp. cluster2_bin.44]|nr:hypothetical protein [Synechococcus sp. cluster2_bin.44]